DQEVAAGRLGTLVVPPLFVPESDDVFEDGCWTLSALVPRRRHGESLVAVDDRHRCVAGKLFAVGPNEFCRTTVLARSADRQIPWRRPKDSFVIANSRHFAEVGLDCIAVHAEVLAIEHLKNFASAVVDVKNPIRLRPHRSSATPVI